MTETDLRRRVVLSYVRDGLSKGAAIRAADKWFANHNLTKLEGADHMTETESMVVRVAKAIVARDDAMLLGNGITDKEAIAYARAAIEAMKDCDNDILEAMWCAMFQDKFTGHELPMLNAGWVAALVKALEE